MKKLISLYLIVLACVFHIQAQKIKGSDTVLPLSQKECETYLKKNPGAKLSVVGGGSGVGLSALIEGSCDIAQSSRKIKFDERSKCQEAKKQVKELIIAYDALALIVHPSNKVTKLTREQLEGIYTGKIKNWKELGGEDLKIIPYSRETSSGTYEFFKEVVLKNKNYMSGIMSMPATGAIVQSVSQTKGAIGYIGLAYLNKGVKAVHVSSDKGKTYCEPSLQSAKNKTYPLVRPLYYYYDGKQEAKFKAFLDYVLSKEGQAIVQEVGFIPVL